MATSSPFPGSGEKSDGKASQNQHSTPTPFVGPLSSAKSPLSNAALFGGRAGSSHAASPVRFTTRALGSISSPAANQTNVPSPATFANVATAVGVQNPLEDSTPRGTGNRAGGQARPVVKLQQDPNIELDTSIDNFLDKRLPRLEAAGMRFFDEYEGSLDEKRSMHKVTEAHAQLLQLYDEMLSDAKQLGLAALPCPASDSSTSAKSLDELHARLINEAKDTFERRERMREGASMATSILTSVLARKQS